MPAIPRSPPLSAVQDRRPAEASAELGKGWVTEAAPRPVYPVPGTWARSARPRRGDAGLGQAGRGPDLISARKFEPQAGLSESVTSHNAGRSDVGVNHRRGRDIRVSRLPLCSGPAPARCTW